MLLIVALLLSPLLQAEMVSTAFDEANRLYEQGKYKEAIAAYHQLASRNQVSSAIYFNLGNAHFRLGQLGHAIASYRLAQQLDPRDPDIRANLRFARESAGVSATSGRRWLRWFNLLTINELTLVTVATVWPLFLVLTLTEFRRDWARPLRPLRTLLALAAALALLCLGFVLRTRFHASSAVVVQKDAAVRYGPFAEAQTFFVLRDGVEVRVLNEKDGWLHISDSSKRTGWLEPGSVVILPPG